MIKHHLFHQNNSYAWKAKIIIINFYNVPKNQKKNLTKCSSLLDTILNRYQSIGIILFTDLNINIKENELLKY